MKLMGLCERGLQLADSDGEGEHGDGEGEADEHEREGLALEVALEAVEGGPRDAEEVAGEEEATRFGRCGSSCT